MPKLTETTVDNGVGGHAGSRLTEALSNESGPRKFAPPEGLATTTRIRSHVMTSPQDTRPTSGTLTIPRIRPSRLCGDLGPRYSCTRPAGHTGRHLYAWRDAGPLTGRVRGVWGCRCDGLLKPGHYCTECGAVRQEDDA